MTPEEELLLSRTIAHFQEIARQNRFAENGSIEHDRSFCAICHPELLSMAPFAIYLEVVTQSIKMRRPSLDDGLVEEINKDLALVGSPVRVSLESLASGGDEALGCWADWLREAINTGLGLLSVHNRTSLEFDLDEEEETSGELIESKIRELMNYQRMNMRGD